MHHEMSSLQRYGRIAFFILILCSATRAAREGAFPLFQQDTAALVQDLLDGNTYEQIYIQYHGCVWSDYGNGADDWDNGCGGDGSETAWYMGRTQCFRSNVAFSLYGVERGEEAPNNPCRKRQFINSYFTTLGADQFATSMGMNNGEVTSYCETLSGSDDANQYTNVVNNGMIFEDYTSSTTACSSDGRFVQALFKGAYCSVRETGDTLDDLEDFNEALEDMACVPIYGASSNSNSNSNSGRRSLAEDNQEGNNNQNNVGGPLLELLAYSEPCSTLEYPQACADPFNVKSSLDYRPASRQPWWKTPTWMDYLSGIFLFLAALFALIPCCDMEDDEDQEQPKKRRGLCLRFRRRHRGDDSSTVNSDGSNSSTKKKGGFRGWFRKKILRRSN